MRLEERRKKVIEILIRNRNSYMYLTDLIEAVFGRGVVKRYTPVQYNSVYRDVCHHLKWYGLVEVKKMGPEERDRIMVKWQKHDLKDKLSVDEFIERRRLENLQKYS